MDRPTIQPFFDSVSSTLTYVVFDQAARVGVVIDPVRDFDLHRARTSWASAAQVAGFVDARGLRLPSLLDTLAPGPLRIRAMHTPGHTPAHMSWRIGDVVFLGDTLFTPDYGTARCDFPGGSASELYDSIQRLYALPDDIRLFV